MARLHAQFYSLILTLVVSEYRDLDHACRCVAERSPRWKLTIELILMTKGNRVSCAKWDSGASLLDLAQRETAPTSSLRGSGAAHLLLVFGVGFGR